MDFNYLLFGPLFLQERFPTFFLYIGALVSHVGTIVHHC